MPVIERMRMQIVKRRLTDLWVVGRELTLDDGQGEPVTVWLQKMNPAEAADTNRRCDAARARTLGAKQDPDSDEWHTVVQTVRDFMGDEPTRVRDYLLVEERAKAMRARESEIANNEFWSKDNRLQGLLDAWDEDMAKQWEEDHDDVRATAIKQQIDAFRAEVEEAVEDDVALASERFDNTDPTELIESMAERLLALDGNQAWMTELAACQVYYGVREADDHKKRYFLGRAEVDQLTPETFRRLHQAYSDMEVDVSEGKDLPALTPSSPSSEEPTEPEVEPSSGLVGASQ